MRGRAWLLIVLILCSAPVLGLNIGVSPGVLNYKNMIKNGYAEREVLVSTSTAEELAGHFEVEGELKDWVRLEPESTTFTVSSSKPYSFKLIIIPPADARNGNYTSLLRVQTDSLASIERGAGSSVIAAVALRFNVEVTGEETIECTGGGISISSTEVDMPFTVIASVLNTGNVRLRPRFIIDVWDQLQETNVFSTGFLAGEILPTTTQRIIKNLEHTLDVGQYFADITINECGLSKRLTFDVVEKGGIADTGDFIGIRTNRYAYRNEPTPIIPVFKNTGPRTVVAKFKGQIKDLDTDRIVKELESEELSIDPGETMNFNMLFTPERSGQYQISGRILYNKKITFEEKSTIVDVVESEGGGGFFQTIWLFIIYVVIGLVILILLAKIRKKKRKR